MITELYEELKQQKNLRENLATLRAAVKEESQKEDLLQLCGEGTVILELLKSEEPKVRKNAALLLGDLGLQQALENLMKAYEKEDTLFVKSSYLQALGKLDCRDALPFLKKQLEILTAKEPEENEKKHINEEIRVIRGILSEKEGIPQHTFCGIEHPREFILTTNREQREVTLTEVLELPDTVKRKAQLHSLGVAVKTDVIWPFLKLRTYRELLFPVPGAGSLDLDAKKAAEKLAQSDCVAFLESCHKEPSPFYFRLEIQSRMPLDQRTAFAKRFAMQFEESTNHKMINSTKTYEVEIRLLEKKDGTFGAFLKLYTISMDRFFYRKNSIATSIHPATAAMMMRLAKGYLQPEAQILDPFCGVGTMLIERDILVPAREKYGIDSFGEAIEKARENAELANEQINFIHRDYFDFTHNYPFDEIVTNMPVRGRRTKEEMDTFVADFFEKSKTLLTAQGIILLYTNEVGFVKKQLRLHGEYKMLQEFCIRKKDEFTLFVIRVAGTAER